MVSRDKEAGAHGAERHPIAQKLLDVVAEMLETTPLDQISLAAVLERSGVSNGSLYHHFEDFGDLVEQAVVRRFTKGLDESRAAIAALLDCVEVEDFRRRAEEIVLLLHDQNRRPFRLARLETFGSLAGRPRLAERIGRAQFESTMKQAEYFAEFQRRGWFRRDLDAAAISTFMTATFLGRVVDDIAEEHIDPTEWSKVAMTAFRAVMYPE